MEDPQERLVRYLQNAHAAEDGVIELLQEFVSESNDSVKLLFQEHLAVTQSQASRLQERLHALGHEPSGEKGFFNALLARVPMSDEDSLYDRTTQNLIKAYAIEHLEQGMYTSLIAYAEACGDEETAMLAEEIMCEEEEAALKLFPMIEVSAVNSYQNAS